MYINRLPIDKIKPYVDQFIEFAKNNPEKNFFVTKIGCGMSKYSPKDIAPLFKDTLELENVYLPQKFIDVLKDK